MTDLFATHKKHLEAELERHHWKMHQIANEVVDQAAATFLHRCPKRALRLVSGMGVAFWLIDGDQLEDLSDGKMRWRDFDLRRDGASGVLMDALDMLDATIPHHGACYAADKTYRE